MFIFLILLFIFLFNTNNCFGENGWYKVEIPSKSNIIGIDFKDKFGVVVTSSGEIFISIDYGNSFIKKSNFIEGSTNITANDISLQIFNSNDIYIAYNKTIYSSHDSCFLWSKYYAIFNKDTLNCKKYYIIDKTHNCLCSYSYTYKLYQKNDNEDWMQNKFRQFIYDNNWKVYNTIFCNNSMTTISSRGDVMNGFIFVADIYINNENIFSTNEDWSLNGDKYISNSSVAIDNTIYISSYKGIKKTSVLSKIWNYIDTNNKGGEIYAIDSLNTYYIPRSGDEIYKITNNTTLKTLVNLDSNDISNISYINKIVVIDSKKAVALLEKYENAITPINYFLKTEDGGGVDLSDVEKVIPQGEITQSTHIELYDILGRSIATFPSYEKLKAEIENYPPPHLIKWRDEKGISHFEKMK